MKKLFFILLLFSSSMLFGQAGTPDWYAYIDSVVNAKIAAGGSGGGVLVDNVAEISLTYVSSPPASQATVVQSYNWSGTLSGTISNDTLTIASTASDFSTSIMVQGNRDMLWERISSTEIRVILIGWLVGSDKSNVIILTDY